MEGSQLGRGCRAAAQIATTHLQYQPVPSGSQEAASTARPNAPFPPMYGLPCTAPWQHHTLQYSGRSASGRAVLHQLKAVQEKLLRSLSRSWYCRETYTALLRGSFRVTYLQGGSPGQNRAAQGTMVIARRGKRSREG